MHVLKEVGPFVGIVAFIGFCVLLYLYIVRVRELRTIREDAPFLADGQEDNGQPSPAESRTAAARARRGQSD
jgi:hypothetical protein